MRLYIWHLLPLILLTATTSAQTNAEKALEKCKAAIKLMDNGQAAASIPLLEEAVRLDPGNASYPYEIAYAKYSMQDYNGALDILKGLVKKDNATDRVYQLLGNSYDNAGKRSKAIEAYDKGLRLFPHAGNLYLERGVMELGVKEYNKALAYFEAGIEADPTFPSNYYWAARIFLGSQEEVWGMIYGEIFMNLERNSKRTEEISKLLYFTYKGEIKFMNDTSASVSFSKNNTINIPYNPGKEDHHQLAEKLKAIKMPYGLGVYEPTLIVSIAGEKIITLASLDRIRSRFLDVYEKAGHQQKYPVVLFDFQRQVRDAGYLEAYNYWILGMGDEQQLADWRDGHEAVWKQFLEWFRDHRISISEENKFYREKYL